MHEPPIPDFDPEDKAPGTGEGEPESSSGF
jgi:hypothetical protein